jgi:hypothetical protein
VILDFNAAGHVVGIELLELTGRVSPEHLRVLSVRDGWAATRAARELSHVRSGVAGVARGGGATAAQRGEQRLRAVRRQRAELRRGSLCREHPFRGEPRLDLLEGKHLVHAVLLPHLARVPIARAPRNRSWPGTAPRHRPEG